MSAPHQTLIPVKEEKKRTSTIPVLDSPTNSPEVVSFVGPIQGQPQDSSVGSEIKSGSPGTTVLVGESKAPQLRPDRIANLRINPAEATEIISKEIKTVEPPEPSNIADMNREEFLRYLTKRSKPLSTAKETLLVDLTFLPPTMQAFIKRLQGILTEVETVQISAENQAKFRARLNAGARSFHDDNNERIPELPPVGPAAEQRTLFFSEFRASLPKAVPNKQQKNIERGKGKTKNRPLREYDTTGWKQAEQSGRLIYDPATDDFDLTCGHYETTEPYFKINAPRPKAGPSTGTLGPDLTFEDFELLLFQAWEESADDLRVISGEDPSPEMPLETETSELKPQTDEFNMMCVQELFTLQKIYHAAYQVAKEKVRKLGLLEEDEKRLEQFGPFTWHGATFFVGDKGGYIFPDPSSNEKLLAYPEDMRAIKEVSDLFVRCIFSSNVANSVPVCHMLAAIVAEPYRHPAAMMDALFAILPDSPLPPTDQAFKGQRLPMTTGGTIGTGGVPAFVLMAEAQSATNVVASVFGERGNIFMLYEELKAIPPKEIVAILKGHIFSVLRLPQPQPGGAQMESNIESTSSPTSKSEGKGKGPAQSKEKNKSPSLSPPKATGPRGSVQLVQVGEKKSPPSAREQKSAPSGKQQQAPQKGKAQGVGIGAPISPADYYSQNFTQGSVKFPTFWKAFADHCKTQTGLLTLADVRNWMAEDSPTKKYAKGPEKADIVKIKQFLGKKQQNLRLRLDFDPDRL